MKASFSVIWLLIGLLAPAARAGATFDLTTASLTLDDHGVVTAMRFQNGPRWPAWKQPVFALDTPQGKVFPRLVRQAGDKMEIDFADGSTARFQVHSERGLAVFRLESFTPRGRVERLQLFRIDAPLTALVGGNLNAAFAEGFTAAVMAAEPNVYAAPSTLESYRADRPGCSHVLEPTDQAKEGRAGARFTATADGKPGGWSVQGRPFKAPLDLSGCKAIRAWIHGDGRKEALKIQLFDGSGGYRDDYIPIDFKGWRHVTLKAPALNTLRYDHVAVLNIYYNGLPENTTVTCLVDQIEAVVERGGRESVVTLEDFEDPGSPLWAQPVHSLTVSTVKEHGLTPASFAVLAVPEAEFWKTVERFEHIAGLPSPRLDGVWNKTSPAVKRSYLFLTNFHEAEFDDALALAQRGGFRMVLLGQESWSRGTGHYEIDRAHFPDGLAGLKRTIGRFHAAGIKVGLHFLSASIYPPDPYIVPVPDRRLVLGVSTTLAADVDAAATFLPTPTPPGAFPAQDGGYEGPGTVLRIGDELISYRDRSMASSPGFSGCTRGYLGTKAAKHGKGERVAHLVRSFGYHLYDMDTTLLNEVAANFARVADACEIDMIYFDGSERLQGDHWYYNPRMHKAFYDAVANKNMLLQASSYSHYSWHMLARSASADGHGDLKGYLDERSPWFDSLAREGLPLDIGWYYGYDPNQTLDQYEYILGTTIGYNSSMSYQVSPAAAARHPFTGPLLDLIRRYEALRLSGRVPEEMKKRLRVSPELAGVKTPEERSRLLDRRKEYHLVERDGRQAFQRVVYEPWREIHPRAEAPEGWSLKVREGPARLGAWLHVQAAPDGKGVTDPWFEAGGKRLDWRGTVRAGQYLVFSPEGTLTLYGPPLKEPRVLAERGERAALEPGEHAVRFGCDAPAGASVRVRIELAPPEVHAIPSAAR